ncbi:MAG TPA: hypothetical protein VF613_03510 [Longimicrobium sp.]
MAGRRGRAMWAGLLLAAAAGCGQDEVEPLPPMERPSPERRAGLPEVAGRWVFAGWEIEPRDSAAQANSDYQLVPPGEFRFLTQRLDSVAGQYGVPGRYVLPFTGEVRRDGAFALIAFAGDGVQQYVAGRVLKDTLWLELTNLASVERWPPRTRAAFVRRPRGAPFTRLLGGAPIIVPPDSATLDSIRRDSIRMDSIRRASTAPPPAATVPGAVPPVSQPGAVPPAAAPPQQQPRPRPPAPRPRPQPKATPPPTQGPPPPQEFPPPEPVPSNPQPPMPRETINFPPPRVR